METKRFNITLADGTERTFVLRPKITMRQRAWYRRVLLQMRAERGNDATHGASAEQGDPAIADVPAVMDVTVGDVLEFTINHPDAAQELLEIAYAGDHTGISWADDVDSDDVEVMVWGFFVLLLAASSKKQTPSPSSTSDIPTGSPATTTETTETPSSTSKVLGT